MNKVEIEFGETKREKLGEEGILVGMFQRPKSGRRPEQYTKVEAPTYNLVEFVPGVPKHCWANINHIVDIRHGRQCWNVFVARSIRTNLANGAVGGMHSNGGFSYEGLNNSACGVLCDVCGLATCACFHHIPQLFLRAIVFVNRCSFAKLIIGQGWEVVLEDGNIVIRQEDDLFFDEIAQEECANAVTLGASSSAFVLR